MEETEVSEVNFLLWNISAEAPEEPYELVDATGAAKLNPSAH